MGGKISNSFVVHSGVPQGSILSPALCLLYINDAKDSLPRNVYLAVYVDDTTLYTTIRLEELPEARNRALQSALTHMQEWGMTWRVAFEPKKSQQMSITRRHNPLQLPTLSFLNETIPTKDCLKLLGVTFDSKLSFGQHLHLHHTSVRAHQRLHALLRKAASVLDSRGRATV